MIRQDLEARDVEVRPCGVLAEARFHKIDHFKTTR